MKNANAEHPPISLGPVYAPDPQITCINELLRFESDFHLELPTTDTMITRINTHLPEHIVFGEYGGALGYWRIGRVGDSEFITDLDEDPEYTP